MKKLEPLGVIGGNAIGAATVENSMAITQKATELSYDPEILLLGNPFLDT